MGFRLAYVSVMETTICSVDHFHKWQLLLYSFVFMFIRSTALILKHKFF